MNGPRLRELGRLQGDLPMPLAVLVGRALEAGSGSALHAAAFYLGEASLKLAAAARVGAWLAAGGRPESALAKSLEALVLPSLGHWCGFLRDASRALAEERGPFAGGLSELGRTPTGWQAVPAFAELVAREGIASRHAARDATRRGVLGFFELLVPYRNEVVGHGAQRSEAFYAELGAALLDALAEVLACDALFAGTRLAVARVEGASDGRASALRFIELTGLSPWRRDEPAGDARDGALYLLGADARVPLHPLVILARDEAGEDRFGFLNKALQKGAQAASLRRVDYLDYARGRPLDGVDTARELAALLGRLRGSAVDATELGRTIASFEAEAETGATDATARARPLDVGDVVAGKYRLLEVLGEGGMGKVYAAEHVMLQRPYAVKVLRPELAQSADLAERFEREARATAALRHPGIVDVVDLGRSEGGSLYLVMERLDGESAAACVGRGPLPLGDALELAAAVLDALEVAHAQSLVHRDIKPDNLFLAREVDGRVVPKILDFGIARVLGAESRLTATGALLGTPAYMAPEQIVGRDVDARADLYAVGATLFHLLAGVPPVVGDSVYAVVNAVSTGAVERDVRRRAPAVPAAVAAVITRALEHDPNARFASAADMKLALAAARTRAPGEPFPRAPPLAWPGLAGDFAWAPTAVAAPLVSPAPAVPRSPPVPAGGARTSRRRLLVGVVGAGAAVAAVAGIVVAVTGARSRTPAGSAASEAHTANARATEGDEGARQAPATGGVEGPVAGMVRFEGPVAGMVRFEGGRFTLGASADDIAKARASCSANPGCSGAAIDREGPAYLVDVAPFYLDQREVTNAQYAGFLTRLGGNPSAPDPALTKATATVDGAPTGAVLYDGHPLVVLDAPLSGLVGLPPHSFGIVPRRGDDAVLGVTWVGADRYCRNLGKRLPTEAEWEFAARDGTGRAWSWGDAPPTCDGIRFGRGPSAGAVCPGAAGATSVHAPGLDRTPGGVDGLAGNAREHTLDPFDARSPGHHPCDGGGPCADRGLTAPDGASHHVVRGASYRDPLMYLRATHRDGLDAEEIDLATGLRCAQSGR